MSGTLANASGGCCEHHDVEVDAANNRIFWTTSGGGLWTGNMDGSGIGIQIAAANGNITGVEYDEVNNKVIYVDMSANEIISINPDGTGAVTLYDATDGLSGARQIAIDPAQNKIWWANRDTDEIMTGSLDGVSAATTLFTGQLGLYGITHDPISGQLFWVTFGANDEVHVGADDGTGTANTIISGAYGSFRDVAIAGSTTPELSWTYDCDDIGTNILDLVAIDMSGNTDTCQTTITVLDTISPSALCQNATVYLDGNGNASTQQTLVYYSSVFGNGIFSAATDGTGAVLVANPSSEIVGMDYRSSSDDLYFAEASSSSASYISAINGGDATTLNNSVAFGSALHDLRLDEANNRYFFTVSYNGIYVANIDGSGTATQLATANNAITGVEYNPATDKVYYTDQANEIRVMDADGNNNTLLYDAADGVSGVRNLAIDPANNRLWITNQNNDEIMLGSMDGLATLTVIYSGENNCYQIDYDSAGDNLFWSLTNGDLRRAKADGSGTPTTITTLSGLRGVRVVSSAGPYVTDNGSSDNCVDLTFSTSPASFTCANIGSTVSVTTTVTDASGNSSSCVSNVTVLDTIAPVFNCLADINTPPNTTACEATVSWVDPTGTDNCSTVITYTYSHASGTDFPLGTTTVTVTADDGNGNTSACTFDVTVTNDLVATHTSTNVSCFGGTDGSIDLTVTGGTTPYTFDWDNDGTGDFDDLEDLTNISDGTYNVVIQDANGCTTNITASITEPATAVNVSLTSQTDPSCGGSDGAIDITVTGGTPVYTYDWDNDGTGDFDDTQDLSGLPIGTYTIIAQDSDGCEDTLAITLINAAAPTLSETHVNPSCFGDMDGSIDLTVTGGTPTYTFDWDNDGTGDNDDTEDISALGGGIYQVIVTDGAACQSQLSVTLIEPSDIVLTSVATGETGVSDGSIDLTVTGGTPSYTFDWDNDGTGDNDDTEDLSGLSQGIYTVIVTDANGCFNTLSDTVNLNSSGLEEGTKMNFTLFPNPSRGMVTIKFEKMPVDGTLNVITSDGKTILTRNITKDVMEIDLTSVARGIYIVEIVSEETRIPARLVIN
ncbi:MAG: T9SS type A sorting domain-containing protein [Crocinitomicaceae bacterium]